MRCAQCGLPLAPRRKNCPRCGATIAEGQSPTSSRGLQDTWAVQERFPSAGAGGMYSGMEASEQGRGGQAAPNSWSAQGAVSVQQMPVSQKPMHNPYGSTLEQFPSPPIVSAGNQKPS